MFISASNYLRTSYDTAKACAIVESSSSGGGQNNQLNSISANEEGNEEANGYDKYHSRELARLPGEEVKIHSFVSVLRIYQWNMCDLLWLSTAIGKGFYRIGNSQLFFVSSPPALDFVIPSAEVQFSTPAYSPLPISSPLWFYLAAIKPREYTPTTKPNLHLVCMEIYCAFYSLSLSRGLIR